MVTLLQGHIGMVIDFEKLKFGKFMKYKNCFQDIYFADKGSFTNYVDKKR